MRVSANIKDPSHNENYLFVKIRLNGIEINDCIMADDLQRMVVRYKRNEKGEFVINKEKDELETFIEYGDVFIDLSGIP